jgi:membrane fusion protein, adhesin transport system
VSNKKAKSAKVAASEINFIDDSRSALMLTSPKFARYSLFLMLSLVLVAIYWAQTNVIDIATVGLGKVVSSSNLQVVQNLEGGIVKEILVTEGEQVKKGMVVIRLDDTRFKASYKKDLAKLALLKIEVIRLMAASEGKDLLTFPAELQKNYPDLVEYAEHLHQKNLTAINRNIAQLRKSIKLVEKELAIIAPLAQKGAISPLEQIRLERELNDLNTQISAKIEEAHNEARIQLNKLRADEAVLREHITASYDRLERTQIDAPVDGVVNKVHVSTIGEVIEPGEKMIEIVPLDNLLTIIIKISPADIGFIKIGQGAVVKVSAYDYAVYGDLESQVVHISADSISDAQGKDYYEVKLQADKNYLTHGDRQLPIRPGMSVTVNILTGKRSILSYLIKPFIDVRETAFVRR